MIETSLFSVLFLNKINLPFIVAIRAHIKRGILVYLKYMGILAVVVSHCDSYIFCNVTCIVFISCTLPIYICLSPVNVTNSIRLSCALKNKATYFDTKYENFPFLLWANLIGVIVSPFSFLQNADISYRDHLCESSQNV